METVSIDGSFGEGGGQILRTSLALACVTGKSLHVENIRAARRNPGLAKQHISCIEAACRICNGRCTGATQGSKVLDFTPLKIHSGNFSFDVGSAGSATLVIQTILPALFLADKPSAVTVTGGTYNPLSPPFDFFAETFLPAIAAGNFHADAQLIKAGFYPVGGGKVKVNVHPWQKQPQQIIDFSQPGKQFKISAKIYTAKLPPEIAQRQRKLLLQSGLDFENIQHVEVTDCAGAGNCVVIQICEGNRTIVFTAFGMKGKPSAKVIGEAVGLTKTFLNSGAAIDHFLADQLLIYMALCGSGCFITSKSSSHLLTNIDVIKKFLPVDFSTEQQRNSYKISCCSDVKNVFGKTIRN